MGRLSYLVTPELSGRIKKIRSDSGKTRQAFADLHGLSLGTIRDVETGKRIGGAPTSLSPDTLERLAKALKINLEQAVALCQRIEDEKDRKTEPGPGTGEVNGNIELEAVGGAVPLNSAMYVVRPTDAEFTSAVARKDSIVLVKAARQMGKTSLLARCLDQARHEKTCVILMDFQTLTDAELGTLESLYLAMAESACDQLDLPLSLREKWNPARSPNVNFERFVQQEIIGRLDGHVLWAMDEVDRLFICPHSSSVFGLFRSWHNARALNPLGPWARLTLAIAYATEAHLFISDLNQSPFNVGTRLMLEDFTLADVAELDRRHGAPLASSEAVAALYQLVGGQPYLIRRGLSEMVSRHMNIEEFQARADQESGPYGDHLRRIVVTLERDPGMCQAVRCILKGDPCPSSDEFYRLSSAGLITGDSRLDCRLRCRVYASYLGRHLL